MFGRFLINPIPSIEFIISGATMGLATFLALPPYDTLIAEGLGAFWMVILFCGLSFASGFTTILGIWRKHRKLRRWGTAGIFLSSVFVSIIILTLAATSTGIWMITLGQGAVAAICHISERPRPWTQF